MATGISFLVIVVQNATTRWVGLGWIVVGLIGYVVYRRRFLGVPVRETVKAPPALGPALALEYRRILVPVVPGRPSDDALDVACRLAAERGARVIALSVVEAPWELARRRVPARGGARLQPRARRGRRDRRLVRRSRHTAARARP